MFDLSNYQPAPERIGLQAADNQDFRYATEEQFVTDPKGVLWVIIKAFIWRTEADTHYWVSGLAAENMSTPFAIEKAETSAYARAITNTGNPKYSTRKDGSLAPRPSREEMERLNDLEKPVVRHQAEIDNWEQILNSKPEGITTLSEGVELVTKDLGASAVPAECKHGRMNRKTGVNSKGSYSGWVCPHPIREEQCKAIWAK
jgi:hypothetical protein